MSEACNKIETEEEKPPTSTTTPPDNTNEKEKEKNRLFIHLVFHPDDISRKRIQELYEVHCGELLRTELKIANPTIAYSRPKNIGDFVTKAKLHQASGESSSTIMGEFKDGLSPP